MKLFICPNTASDQQINQAKECIAALTKQCGAQCFCSQSDSRLIFPALPYSGVMPDECDIVVAIGGDGAVLRAAQTAVLYDKPLIGINGGRLGYLCSFDISDVVNLTPDSFEKLKKVKRSLLSVEYGGKTHFVLNDIVIDKHNLGRTTELEISSGGSKLITWRCDGVIISTPTGSTAYNLSAGGPIVMPDVEAVLITPICSHSLFSRSLILSGSEPITVSITARADNQAYVSADGVVLGEIQSTVTISRYNKQLTLLAKGDTDFSDALYKISSRGAGI